MIFCISIDSSLWFGHLHSLSIYFYNVPNKSYLLNLLHCNRGRTSCYDLTDVCHGKQVYWINVQNRISKSVIELKYGVQIPIFELQLELEYKMLVTILWSNKLSRNVITSNKDVVDIFRAFVSTTWTISQEFPVITYITIENQSVGDGVTDAVPANQCNISIRISSLSQWKSYHTISIFGT